MRKINKNNIHLKSITILAGVIVALSIILFSSSVSYAMSNTGSIEINVYNTNGDIINNYGQTLKIYQDVDQSVYKVITPDHYPLTVNSLPLGHHYKIDVYRFSMYAGSNYVDLQNPYEKVDLKIPLDTGVRFNVFFNDGQTPINNATISLKSQDGVEWATDHTDYKGSTSRLWIQSTSKEGDYYTATFSIGKNFTYNFPTQLTPSPGSQSDFKIITPWSSLVENFVVSVYDSTLQKIKNSNGIYFGELTDNAGNIISQSSIDSHGQIYFSNIKTDNYVLHIMKTSKDHMTVEVGSKNILIGNNISSVDFYLQNTTRSENVSQKATSPPIHNTLETENAKAGTLTPVHSATYTPTPAVEIPMNDTTTTYGLSTYAGIPIQAEYVSSTSSLVGKSIDTIIVGLRSGGTPTGVIQIGVFNNDLSVKKIFGTKDATTLTTSYIRYSFSLNSSQTYQIQSDDRIGIKFTGGNVTNFVAIMTDQNDTFDNTNSYLTYFYGTNWINNNAVDISMILKHNWNPTYSSFLIPPRDILSVTTNSSRNIPDLGIPHITSGGSSPVFTNNSTGNFPIGTTKILWRTADSQGNIETAIQKIIVIYAPPSTNSFNKVAMVQFDDNPESIFTLGKPILDKYNIKTTQFVVCGTAGSSSDFMTWPQILQMQSEGHDIQSHTMTHFHQTISSVERMDYEYGKSKPCLTNHGIMNVHVLALPYYEGYKNNTAINIISKYYDFSRGGPGNSFYLHCNDPLSTQTDCRTFDSNGNLNLFNRYNIRAWSSDDVASPLNFNDTLSFEKFISEVNSATTNTSYNSTQIPILLYHKVVQDNSVFIDTRERGTTVTLLDAEMKYLMDNNFIIYTTKDLKYNADKNWFYISPHTATPKNTDTITAEYVPVDIVKPVGTVTVPEFNLASLVLVTSIAAIIAISTLKINGSNYKQK